MMKRLFAVVLALVFCLSAAALAETNPNAGMGYYPGSSETGAIHAQITTMSVMNPIKMTYSNEFSIARHVWDNLVKADSETNATVPGAAESWECSDDGMVWTFHIMPGQKWVNSKGEAVAEVTAKDFEFGWHELLNPANACEYYSFPLNLKNAQAYYDFASGVEGAPEVTIDQVGVHAVDDYTLVVELEYYVPYFLECAKFEAMAPIYEPFYTEVGADMYGTSPETLLYNGPFYMSNWVLENTVTVEKNPNWRCADMVEVQKIYWDKYTDTNTQLNAFMAGELDIFDLTGEQVKMLNAEGYQTVAYSGGYSYWFWVNTTDATLSNVNLRRAISAALDRQIIIDTVFQNGNQPSQTATLGIKGVNTVTFSEAAVTAHGGSYYEPSANVEAAKAFLADAMAEMGVTDPAQIKVALMTSEGTQNELLSAVVQEQLGKALGITVDIDVTTITEARARRNALDFQLFMGGWGPDYNDPKTDLELFQSANGNNHTGWANDEYDALIAATDAEVDPVAREQLFVKCEDMIASELPVIPVYWRQEDYAVSEKMVEGFSRLPFQAYNLIYTKLAK